MVKLVTSKNYFLLLKQIIKIASEKISQHSPKDEHLEIIQDTADELDYLINNCEIIKK